MGAFYFRQLIREVLEELYQGSKNTYPTSNTNEFPYFTDDNGAARLPQDIDPISNEYIQDFSSYASNRDAYKFPYEEFKLGMQIEQNKNPNFNILEIAEKVINNLKDNIQFYSNLEGQ
jgi:hypothetical protein